MSRYHFYLVSFVVAIVSGGLLLKYSVDITGGDVRSFVIFCIMFGIFGVSGSLTYYFYAHRTQQGKHKHDTLAKAKEITNEKKAN
ncbi:hypothetical protein L336_0352 [Candidatus Saccharimonas aalborgensis]|uniref:Uncharacterized protein n=1 Tax=Candidatus Saccharimonas aalborgensis TaxID=1332188 RepID=R4PV40_9BACT|nr:hypothetical protein [Candidatus Saccharimonas aalborgensis]MBP7775308.1 hypothetical protein [Candidatus Saccharimonas sp.]QQR50835.1 MAG: hypothetical protein IPF89_03570 [Candidatus Saccharibacteria bacterium]AGL62060.1 hypothetical protein L336_0352 [Candidatus Saccharimonas aalborgensis]QQS68583.1 MAG: hypothetical protein IPP24_00930 [Candidatus Saccharibacteria bacterium]QQS70881.1 MAG: hypothetical protein IPP92_01100 [Candidatus Saccharibacteria bacterium]